MVYEITRVGDENCVADGADFLGVGEFAGG